MTAADADRVLAGQPGFPLLARVLASSFDGVTVLDGAGRFVYLNPAACEILGCRPEDLLGVDALRMFAPREHGRAAAQLRDVGCQFRQRGAVRRPAA